MNVPKSPLTQFADALKASERFTKDRIVVLFGARELARLGAPNRVVLFPVSAIYENPEHNGNWRDVPLSLAARCWGETFDVAREIRNRVVNAAMDFQLSTDLLRVDLQGEQWDTEPDTDRQGFEVQVNFSVRDVVEKVPLSADAGSATVDNEQFAPDDSTAGPTVTYPP